MSSGKKNKTGENQVNEPSSSYGSNRIHFFKSSQEQENDNYAWLASLTPEEHLYNATQLIMRIYSEELIKNPTIGNRITLDR